MIGVTELRGLSVRMATILIEIAWMYEHFLLPADRERYLELARANADTASRETHVMQMADCLVSIIEKYGSQIPEGHLFRVDQCVYQYWQVTGNTIGKVE